MCLHKTSIKLSAKVIFFSYIFRCCIKMERKFRRRASPTVDIGDVRSKEESETDFEWLRRVMNDRPLQTVSYRFMTLQLVRYAVKMFTLFNGQNRFASEQLSKVERGNWLELLSLVDDDRSARHCYNLK